MNLFRENHSNEMKIYGSAVRFMCKIEMYLIISEQSWGNDIKNWRPALAHLNVT